MKLIKPNKKYIKSYVKTIREGFPIGGCNDDYIFVESNFDQHIKNIYRPRTIWNDGIYREDVPFERYWIIDNDIFIGHLVIREHMTDFHKLVGGNIGYRIRKGFYNHGYATKALRMALDICKNKSMSEILITCDDDNVASIRVIEKNNGILQDKVKVVWSSVLVRRYLIEVV
jgi:predicted acetyltransferase